MATKNNPQPNVDADALDWSMAHFNFASSELLRDSPWARTYRLNGGADAAYLKVLPDHQQPVVKTTMILAEHFPCDVPAIIACDAERCWLLSADHGASVLSYDSHETELRKILATYASLQVQALALPDLLASLRRADLDSLLANFLSFLQPQDNKQDSLQCQVWAEYYIGRNEARRYFRALSLCSTLLRRHLKPAAELPATLCHGDLRPPNTAIGPNGDCVLCDWDDATMAPAGFSLHAMFSGCFKPTVLLLENKETAREIAGEQRAQRLETYIDALTSGGYVDESTLRSALPASICAGVLHYVLNFAHYSSASRTFKKAVARSITSRLSDLLDLCDLLASREREATLRCALDYENTGQYRRAQHLLQRYLTGQHADADMHAVLARVLKARGKVNEALAACRHALELAPNQAQLHNDLGVMLLEQSVINQASAAFSRALELDPDLTAAQYNLERAAALELVQRRAEERSAVPTLIYSAEEAGNGLLRPEKLALAASLFEAHGVLQVNNVFPVAMVKRLQEAFFARYTDYFRKDNHPDALRLGDQRYMLTVDLEAPFNDANLYASPLLLPILHRLLGHNCIIGAFTAVISLPGSKDQSLHKDAPALFPATELQHRLPHFAIQLIVPLVPLDRNVGTTRVIKGSHTVPLEQAKAMAAQDPIVPLGSCLLTDYRVSHRGLGNRSNQVRPILTIIYNRPWFRDHVNYAKQPPLRIDENQYEHIPPDQWKLFNWWREEQLR